MWPAAKLATSRATSQLVPVALMPDASLLKVFSGAPSGLSMMLPHSRSVVGG
jgi:hypothetical protein